MANSQNDTTETTYRIARHTEVRVRDLVDNLGVDNLDAIMVSSSAGRAGDSQRLGHGVSGSQHLTRRWPGRRSRVWDQYAPLPEKTAGTVFNSSATSWRSVHVSMYSRSSATQVSNRGPSAR